MRTEAYDGTKWTSVSKRPNAMTYANAPFSYGSICIHGWLVCIAVPLIVIISERKSKVVDVAQSLFATIVRMKFIISHAPIGMIIAH